jgi:hypothetical protein
MLPWSLYLPTVVGDFWRERRQTGHNVRLYLVLWAVVIFVFFSKSDSKLIPYILPVFPALALLTGRSFAQAAEGKVGLPRWQSYTVAACLALTGGVLLSYPHLTRGAELTGADALLPALLLFGAAALTFTFTRTDKIAALFLSLCLSFYLLGLITTTTVLAQVTGPRNCKQLALIARNNAGPDDLIASFGDYEQGLAFYTGRRTVLIGGRGELEFGSHQGDNEAWFIEPARFDALWHSPVRIFMVIHKPELEMLRAFRLAPLHIIDQHDEKLLVTNQ